MALFSRNGGTWVSLMVVLVFLSATPPNLLRLPGTALVGPIPPNIMGRLTQLRVLFFHSIGDGGVRGPAFDWWLVVVAVNLKTSLISPILSWRVSPFHAKTAAESGAIAAAAWSCVDKMLHEHHRGGRSRPGRCP
ncbi:hypothetical protein Vadar_032460 [Vaccinium darrowii]|uniref:Uncharacterized protein n=1 Tax=Vaccinium darrowii TaxID=229202 RepID=A0ACB7ZMZ7_9ERIC|nr:hypothetical protein Vadar_032460 [Vaccinium darrowii]